MPVPPDHATGRRRLAARVTGPSAASGRSGASGHPVHPGYSDASDASDPSDASDVGWADDLIVALGSVDPVDRAALRLIYWDGMTQPQVARRLHLPEQVVRRCVARGMRTLATHLTDPRSG